MRLWVSLIVILGLAACQAGLQTGVPGGKGKPAPDAFTGGPIEVTALDAPAAKPGAKSRAAAETGAEAAKPEPQAGSARTPAPKPASAPAKVPDGDTPAVQREAGAGPKPAAKPGTEPKEAAQAEPVLEAPEAAPADPAKPRSPQQVACEKKGGKWAVAGKSGANTCVQPTGEGTKQCTRQTDCKGLCLARSGTCAPFSPVFGCNDILQADGSRVTLCID